MSRVRSDCLPAVIGELTSFAKWLASSEDEAVKKVAVAVMHRARAVAQGADLHLADASGISFLRNSTVVNTKEKE